MFVCLFDLILWYTTAMIIKILTPMGHIHYYYTNDMCSILAEGRTEIHKHRQLKNANVW
jgi:hypothetical protein